MAEDRTVQVIVEQSVGVVAPHLLFAENHFALFGKTRFGKLRKTNHVRENPHRFRQMPPREIRVIGGVIVTGVGIHRAAETIDRIGRRRSGIIAAALKQHVFEEVRETVSEIFPLVNAAGPDEALDFNRRSRLGKDKDLNAVFQRA